MTIEKILIISEEETMRRFLAEIFSRWKIEVKSVLDSQGAINQIKIHNFDLVMVDVNRSIPSGLELLKQIKTVSPHTIVIFMTPYDNLSYAAETIRLGAFNYLIKPFSPETLEAMIEKAKEHSALLYENQYLRDEISQKETVAKMHIIAESPLMKQILHDVAKIAKSHASVFISGESGTGKEIIAHTIHFQSDRAQMPFIKVNCAAIPDTLIESEFFGHEKGSFTGAINRRLGRFELADKGTLLLDEVSEIPLNLQSKLLRVIQEQEFERVGGVRPIEVDVRLISTSNRNMKEAIEQKLFREDLYFRLNVVPIYLPPLRERHEDIHPLSEYFLEKLCIENNKPRKRLSQEARKKLLDYHWPGNIRELANIIERAVVMNSSQWINPEELLLDPFSYPKHLPKIDDSSGMTLEEIEKRHILETLSAQHHNRTKTAKALGISLRTLRNKLNKYRSLAEK